jgi:uncharacterized protein (TIGR01244 family)
MPIDKRLPPPLTQELAMPVDLNRITDDFSVSAQLSPADFVEMARQGVVSIINNRPDGEDGASQSTDAELRTAAEAAGLFYAYLPVPAASFDDRAVLRMRALVGELPKPVHAFCRTGRRSEKLYRAAASNGYTAPVRIAAHEQKRMEANVGSIDRIARVAAGLGLITATLTGAIGDWGWLGMVPLATGVLRFCPAYLPFGLTTYRSKT